MREPTHIEIDDACMSYRHDFGLLSIAEANAVRFEAKEWLRAWRKVPAFDVLPHNAGEGEV